MIRIEDGSGTWFSIEAIEHRPEHWILASVSAGTQWFKGGFEAEFHTKEIAAVIHELERLHVELAGGYRFQAYEGTVDMTFAMGKRGDIAVSVRLQYSPDYLHELRIVINIDQSYLPGIIDGFRSLLER